jgi:hypothetical protein
VQDCNFLPSHCVERMCISLELSMISYSSIKYVKENTSLNCIVIFLLVKNCPVQKKSVGS